MTCCPGSKHNDGDFTATYPVNLPRKASSTLEVCPRLQTATMGFSCWKFSWVTWAGFPSISMTNSNIFLTPTRNTVRENNSSCNRDIPNRGLSTCKHRRQLWLHKPITLTCKIPPAPRGLLQKYIKRGKDRLSMCNSHTDKAQLGRLSKPLSNARQGREKPPRKATARTCQQEAFTAWQKLPGSRSTVCAEGDTCGGNIPLHTTIPEAGSNGIHIYYSVVHTGQRKYCVTWA